MQIFRRAGGVATEILHRFVSLDFVGDTIVRGEGTDYCLATRLYRTGTIRGPGRQYSQIFRRSSVGRSLNCGKLEARSIIRLWFRKHETTRFKAERYIYRDSWTYLCLYRRELPWHEEDRRGTRGVPND